MVTSEKNSFPRNIIGNYNENVTELSRSLENLPGQNTKRDLQRSFKVCRHCKKNKHNINKFPLNQDVTKLNFNDENSINENIFGEQLQDNSVNYLQPKMINLNFTNNDEQNLKQTEQDEQLMDKEIDMANMKANEIKKAQKLVHKIIFKKKNPIVKIILRQNNLTENAINELCTNINFKNEIKGNKKYPLTLPKFNNKPRNFPVSPDPLTNNDSKSLRDYKTKPDDKYWYINFLNCNISIMNSSLNAINTRIYTSNSHWWNPTTNTFMSNIKNRLYNDQMWNYTTWHQTYRTFMTEKPSIYVSTPFKLGNASALKDSESNYILFNNSAQVVLNFWNSNVLTNINKSDTYHPKYSISEISENTDDMLRQMNDNIEIRVTQPELLIQENPKDNNSNKFFTKFRQENYTADVTDYNKLTEINGLKYTEVVILNFLKNNNSKSSSRNDYTSADPDSISNFIKIPKSMKNIYYDHDKPDIENYLLQYGNARHGFFNTGESLKNNQFNINEVLHTTESKTFPPLFVHHSKKDYYHYIVKPNEIHSHSINKITLQNQHGKTISKNTVVGPSSLVSTNVPVKTKTDNNTLPKKMSKTKNFWSLLNSFNSNVNDRTASETRSEPQKNKLRTTQGLEFHFSDSKSLKKSDSTKFSNEKNNSHDNIMNSTEYFRYNETNTYMDKNKYDALKPFIPRAKAEEFKDKIDMRSPLNRLKNSGHELRLPNEYNLHPFIDIKEEDDDYEDDENINTETNTNSKEAENFQFLDFIDKSIHSLQEMIANNNRSNDNRIILKSLETHKATESYLNDKNNFKNEKQEVSDKEKQVE